MNHKIAVLMTCHNRRNKTLVCLRSLWRSIEDAKDVEATVFLVDDGSTDGTAASVSKEFPEVHLLKGDGTLYWARGMHMSWECAVSINVDWDGYLWLNDDIELDRNALSRTMGRTKDNPNNIIVGALRDRASGCTVYGIADNGLFTGSFVFIPRIVYQKIGVLSNLYKHAWADYDYCMKCKRAGISYCSISSTVGVVESHPLRPSLKALSLVERWRMLSNPKGWCLSDLWTYRIRNFGFFSAVLSCIHMVVHVLVARE